jgi:hypothetical protein
MKNSLWIILLSILLSAEALSQELKWKAGISSFFDNTEFGNSKYQVPQTMAGLRVAPEAGIKVDSVHMAFAGVDMLHEFGSSRAIDNLYLTAYYSFDKRPVRFMMGSFPRAGLLDKYPRLFFQDSILYYRPNINGIFCEVRRSDYYFNLWLDWTGRQSATVHEAFFIGFSGRYRTGRFYLQHFDYMFHFASVRRPVVEEALHDNLMILTSAGIDLAGLTIFDKLCTDAGWVTGLERARADNTGFLTHNGLLVQSTLEYRMFGLFNSFYIGGRQMSFYRDHGSELYWGDPIYRAGTYNRSDIYINFIRNKAVSLRLDYSLHFAEGRIYHEQSLKVAFNLNNL